MLLLLSHQALFDFWDLIDCGTAGFPGLHYWKKFAEIYVHWGLFIHLILCHPLFPLPSIFTSIRVFSNESVFLYQLAKVLELQLQHRSFQWIFRVDFLKELTGLISLQSKGLSRVFSNTTVQKHPFFGAQPSLWVQLIYPYMTTGKPVVLTICLLPAKWYLCFLIWCHSFPYKKQVSFNFVAAVTVPSDFGAQEKKICHCFHFLFSICHEVMGPDAMILVFWMLSFQPAFRLSSFTLIKRLFSSSSLSALRVVLPAYLYLLIFLPATLIPACVSSSPAFHRIYSAYKLSKQGDSIQPCRTPFPI